MIYDFSRSTDIVVGAVIEARKEAWWAKDFFSITFLPQKGIIYDVHAGFLRRDELFQGACGETRVKADRESVSL